MDHNEMYGKCSDCHNGVVAKGKSTLHPQSSNICDACHAAPPSIRSWTPVVRVDHSQLYGTCIACHGSSGQFGRKPTTHPSTTDNCSACHLTSAWRPVITVDHNEVLGACAACHNGVIATGRSVLHATTTNLCQACHSTINFRPATRVDHTQVLGLCASCHNGVIASGLPSGHDPITQDCGACHTPAGW